MARERELVKGTVITRESTQKRVKWTKMTISKPCNNLGTPRTENWQIIFNLLIGRIHPELNFRGIRLFGKFRTGYFLSFWCAKIGHR